MKVLPPSSRTQREFKSISLLFILAGMLLGFGLGWKISQGGNHEKQDGIEASASIHPASAMILRKHDNPYVGPEILSEFSTESSELAPLKGTLTETIRQFVQKGLITQASVYLKRLNDGSWMTINGDETYLPGSLMKVAIMIYYLRQEELHPGMLGREFECSRPRGEFPVQDFEGDKMVSGKNYKVSDLLRFMIMESDNLATNVLARHLDAQQFRQLFTDLGMPPDNINDINYVISSREYSKFLRVLYDASYLNEKSSEYALKLLAESSFREGMVKKLPPDLLVARKFGERGRDAVMDFSESGLVYKHNDPYVLTIMTRGSNSHDQAEVISELSGEVYRMLESN
jgi:beta-lactamase class A